jgi:hypothetical protein
MPFQKTQWLFPIAVSLHSSEETVCMPNWVAVCTAGSFRYTREPPRFGSDCYCSP